MKFWENIWHWLQDIAPNAMGAAIVFAVGWLLSGLLSKLVRKAMHRGKMDAGIISFVYSISKNSLRVIVIISAAAQLGVNVTSIIAALGAAGVTIGLALKDSLANVASGALIIINKPFHAGDYLQVEGLEGTVTKIEMMYTTLTTFDNKEVIIPNSRLTSNNIVNYTAQKTRRLDLAYTIGYGDDIAFAKQVLHSLVEQNEKALKSPEPIIAVTEHQASGVVIAVKVWCGVEDYWPLYFEMQETVKLAFDENGITIPYPQMDVHMHTDAEN
jgi:small conductance mechanosensitive channel